MSARKKTSKPKQGLWFVALLGLFISCLGASWLLQAKGHYGYTFWYDFFAIQSHIEKYAPQNYYKEGFAALPASEHIRAFNEISEAVHQQGLGLSEIQYQYRGEAVPLLTQAECVHLQDVANLIDVLTYSAAVVAALTILLLFYLVKSQSAPQPRMQLRALLLLLIGAPVLVWALGAKKVFYQLHVWIFPEGHQWFFYYQESLMSTLMKAPDLFAGIGIAIFLGAILLFVLMLLALYFLKWRSGFKA
ncbi:MAG: hypothetical protein RL217_867 [Pseudomonadota bacterium]|jgi:hypothetical protein